MAITKIGTPELFDFSATNTALQLPTGTTLERPTSPSAGQWRFNTTEKYIEFWDGGAWRQIDTDASVVPLVASENFNVNTYFGNGATQAIDAKFNEAANFNGSSSKIQLPSDVSVATGNNDFTLSTWVYLDNIPSGNTSIITTQANYYFYIFVGSDGSVKTYNQTVQVNSAAGVITTGTWYNIVATLSSTTGKKVYVNGTSVASSSDTSNCGSLAGQNAHNAVGYYNSNGSTNQYYLDGKIDQIRMFNTALPATGTGSVAALYAETTTTAATLNFPAGAGCIAAYQLDGDASDVGGTYGGVTTDIGYTGFKFTPDLIWIKDRDATLNHLLADTVRGISTNSSNTTSLLIPNSTLAELTNRSEIRNLGNNGFDVTGTNSGTNTTNNEYVAWCWKAGGAPTATNSAGAGNVPTAGSVKIDGADSTTALAGTIAATKISANTNAGFSIVSLTGTGSAGSVGHGLNSAPELIIMKNRDGTNSWVVRSSDLGNGYVLLNGAGSYSSTAFWGNPTSTVFSFTSNSSASNLNEKHIAYCFHSVDGYQRVGSYTGTGNNPGPIVYTTDDGTATGTDGFEPAMIIIKRTDSAEDWKIIDNKRGFVNSLEPNEAIAEEANNNSGFIAARNGFQINDTSGDYNANGGTYIYLAIAADKDSSVPTLANSFSPTIYTGNGGTQNIYTPFAPDFTWIKSRSNGRNHRLLDSIRGATKVLSSDSTSSEYNEDSLTSFDSNGFTLGTGGNQNRLNETYVAWNWKAGGLPTINSDGTIPSIVSANVAAGFSIVSYTGNGSSSADVGHGLASIPELCIFKQRSSGGTSGGYWNTYLTAGNKVAFLNETNAFVSNTAGTNGTIDIANMNATKFGFLNGSSSVNNQNNSGSTYIAYFFTSKSGYQKVGSYTGTGNTGNTVNVGFTPRWVMIKSTSNAEPWFILDAARNPSNPRNDRLMADSSASESVGSVHTVDFTGNNLIMNGTVGNGTNGLNVEYIFLAIG